MTMSTLSAHVSERIRELRNTRGLSQEQLANKANLNTSFIGAIERDVKKPTVDTLDKIITALDISVQDFFNFEIDLSKNETSDDLNKLIYIVKDLNEKDQETIYNLVKQIITFKNRK
jgi:transcriptional regulator with XRE-family HTH domain